MQGTKSVDIGGGNRAFDPSKAQHIGFRELSGTHCVFCGNPFSNPKNSTRRRTVVWVRKLIRSAGALYKVHGSVDAACNDKLDELAVAQLA